MSDSGSEFEWLRQHLAMRGYAVVQPQFRGSSGFGAQFERAGDLEWGMLMQDDLTDGVHAVIDQGRIDPHRICILGDSNSDGYAGYTALAGAAFTPDLYKCAISVNGIADLPNYLGYLTEQSANMSYWHRTLGMPTDPGVIARSPIHAANQMSASILLMYSADDTVVPPRQSEILAESLKTAGKSVQLVEIPHADHALSHQAARLRAMEEIDRFLDDHL
jgi:dipeptidyl aminopeptidase/acylaminoacyl peptidase